MRPGRLALCLAFVLAHAGWAAAQTISQRGFVEGSAFWYPQDAPSDTVNGVGDVLARQDVFARPARWLQLTGGLEFRVGSHDQVEDDWSVDMADRGLRRPRLSVRRLSATLTRGPLTVDVGKQFVRWGKTDLVNPTDRFAPRDFLNVVEPDFLGIVAGRAVVQAGAHTFDAVVTPRFTPSRVPLFGQRWTPAPAEVGNLVIDERPATFPGGWQAGIRWGHIANRFEYSVSLFDGVNHLPTFQVQAPNLLQPARVEIEPVYPSTRSIGADVAIPSHWVTVKGEAAYVRSTADVADDYVLYVAQVERQQGEWMFVGGYVGEVVTRERSNFTFDPDRGMSRAIMARASYTIDANRSLLFEGAGRQTGDGGYAKVEYSQARGGHWRTTIAGVVIAGERDDFFGQYRRNSHVQAALRYSF